MPKGSVSDWWSVTYWEPIYGVVSTSLTLSHSLRYPHLALMQFQSEDREPHMPPQGIAPCNLSLTTLNGNLQCARIEPMDWLTSHDQSLNVIRLEIPTLKPITPKGSVSDWWSVTYQEPIYGVVSASLTTTRHVYNWIFPSKTGWLNVEQQNFLFVCVAQRTVPNNWCTWEKIHWYFFLKFNVACSTWPASSTKFFSI